MSMSFREKSTWISFVLLLMLLGGYVWPLYKASSGQTDGGDLLGYYHNLLIAFVALQVLLHVIVLVQSPRDARTPKDERERSIELKAFRIGFYVLVVGVLAATFVGLHVASPYLVGYWMLASLMVAWLAKLCTQIVHYRRGS
jgi:hypothetical protein